LQKRSSTIPPSPLSLSLLGNFPPTRRSFSCFGSCSAFCAALMEEIKWACAMAGQAADAPWGRARLPATARTSSHPAQERTEPLSFPPTRCCCLFAQHILYGPSTSTVAAEVTGPTCQRATAFYKVNLSASSNEPFPCYLGLNVIQTKIRYVRPVNRKYLLRM
jgi:hypothetical protein